MTSIQQTLAQTDDHIRPVQFLSVGKQTQVPMPFIRVTTCGLLTIEIVEEVVSTDPPRARYASLTPEQLRGRGTAPSLHLLKLFLNRHERFASRDWLMEQFCRESELFAAVRLDNIVSLLRSLLCPVTYSELRTHLVAHVRGSTHSQDGFQLAAYPFIWVDSDALAWHVQQAVRMERFGDDGLPFWERAYEIAKRGPYLPDEVDSDWTAFQRGEVAGMLRQSVQALARLYVTRHGAAGEEEALLLMRRYWQANRREEDVLRPLMELLGRRECFHEAIEYYEQLCDLLAVDDHQPDAQTQDLAEYLRTKQLQRARVIPPPPSPPLSNKLSTHTSALVAAGLTDSSLSLVQGADFNASSNKISLDLVYEALKQGIMEATLTLGNQTAPNTFLLEQGSGMAHFDSTKRVALRQIAALLGEVASGYQIFKGLEWQGQIPVQPQTSKSVDLDLIENYIDALSTLLAKGEAYYVMHASQKLYHQFVQENLSAEDIRLADIHLKLGFLVAAAQEYALAWYQRDKAVVQTYNHMEHTILHQFDGNRYFQQAYARLLAKRGRQHRVLWRFDLCEKECEDGLALTNEFDDYSLRTHFFCERAHIEATRGDQVLWMNKLEAARTGALNMPPIEREKALKQINYMQGEGYKRFAFHTQKAFSFAQREKYAKLSLNYITQWDGTSIELPGFETCVANISRAQCFILLDPGQAIALAEQQKLLAEQRYPALLAKIYRIVFLAQQRIEMTSDEFLQVFQGTSYTAYQTGLNIL
jgi:hypothetical protein